MFRKNIIGIEISDTAIKIVQLTLEKTIITQGKTTIPHGVVKQGTITDCATFTQLCMKALGETKPISLQDDFIKEQAIVSISVAHVWSHTVTVPQDIPQSRLAQYVYQEAEKIVPITFSELYTAHTVTVTRGVRFATIIGAPKHIIDGYMSCLQQAGLSVGFIGNSFYAIARAVLPPVFGDDNYLLIHVHADMVTMGVFDENAIAYMVTESMCRKPSVHTEHEYHMSQTAHVTTTSDMSAHYMHDGDTPSAECYTHIPREVEDLITYFHTQTGQSVTKILVTGASSTIPILLEELAARMSITISQGDACANITHTERSKSNTIDTSYAAVIGLALYGIDTSLPHINVLPRVHNTEQSLHARIYNATIAISQKTRHVMRESKNWHYVVTLGFVLCAVLILFFVIQHYT